jgi:hypothetical protein
MTIATTTTPSAPPQVGAGLPKISMADAANIQNTKQHIVKLAAHQKRLQEIRSGLEKTLTTHPNPTLVASTKVAGYPPAKLDQTPTAPVNPYSSAAAASKSHNN